MKKLRSLTIIVDSEDDTEVDSTADASLDELKRSLPDVDVTVLDSLPPFPVPDVFRQHAKHVKQEVVEKYSK